MLNPLQFKSLFVLVIVTLGLMAASPALQHFLVYPQTDSYTEVWMLGSAHLANGYPHDVRTGISYNVFLGVTNHLNSCAYYQINVKFRNETQSAPNGLSKTPSSMPSLYSINLFVAQNEIREIPITFSMDYTFRNVTRTVYSNVTVSRGAEGNVTIEQKTDLTVPQVNFERLTLNGLNLNITAYSSDYNLTTSSIFGNLIFEVWIYNDAIGGFQYHERFVDLKLNMISALE